MAVWIEVRQLAINNPPILRKIFVCLKSCCVERIAGYVTEAARLKTNKKASKVGGLLIASCLTRIKEYIFHVKPPLQPLFFHYQQR